MALKKHGSMKRVEGHKPNAKVSPAQPLQNAVDTRRVYYAHELPAELIAELEKGYQGEPTLHLDHLLK